MMNVLSYLFVFFFLMIRRPPRSTRTHSFPTRRSSDLYGGGRIFDVQIGAAGEHADMGDRRGDGGGAARDGAVDPLAREEQRAPDPPDRKSTRLNSSH